jgi:hypothetical protein
MVGYLGLDPKARQSGIAPAKSGRISKQGSASARWALVEAMPPKPTPHKAICDPPANHQRPISYPNFVPKFASKPLTFIDRPKQHSGQA